jgi:RimJ/RimL family protein N-acetyltransferase
LEIGWSFLARGYWGGVYNREMKRLMLEHAFQFVDRVIFVVGVDNVRSRKAMLNIGGVLTDRRVAQALPAVRSESVVFEIAKDRWSG